MKDIKKRCEKCGLALEWQDRCDYCGKVLPTEEIFRFYLTVRRTDPENEDVFTFQFCNYECMVLWMQKRKLEYFDGEADGTMPYHWEHESRSMVKEQKP